MTLTEDEAAKLANSMLPLLRSIGASEVLEGVDESRRLGIEEALPEQKGSELKQVARTRRRPPNNVEMFHLIFERLYQRLAVLPSIAKAIQKRLGVENVVLRVDTEFASPGRFPEAQSLDLLPDGVESVLESLTQIRRLLAEDGKS